ncbi:hypothetical protein AcdelDRAFT_0854 [Acidovorax delafieldii 2AN]|uniref:Uncharacterized protein n=2 Tax=Acidovorax delafieldii TaxID=47920 RepID=C5T1S4_ACIDE|nr:hypothetical protein AcdelDRAFT_0854 [Acidovorax delafieldii 2AN]
MGNDELLYELRSLEGHVWRLYLDGRTEGFPAGTLVSNFALAWNARVVGEVEKQSVCLAAQ